VRAAAALLALALLLRLAAVAVVDVTPVNDPADYVRHGLSIAAGDGFPPSDVASGPTAIRPPVYPALVAAAFAVSGDAVDAARVLNAVLGTAVAALTGLLAFRLWGRRAGLAALAFAAVCPPQLVVGATLLSETAFTALALGALLVVLASREPGRGVLAGHRRDGSPRALRAAALAGLLVGLAVLTRVNGAVLLLPLLVLIGRRPRQAGVLVAVAALTVLPWTLRNAVVLDAFVAVSTSAPYTLSGTYNDASRTDPDLPYAWRPATLDPAMARLLAAHPDDDELTRGGRLGDAAREHVAEHPTAPLAATARNLLRWTHLDGAAFARLSAASDGLPRWTGTFAALGTLVLLLLAAVGVARGALRGTPRALWLAPVLLVVSVASTVSAVRYRAPAEPFLVLLAAYALSHGMHGVALRRPVA
jgi:4-amino-4-deoxy-L-arabinose transferase-like glycosyltransferase